MTERKVSAEDTRLGACLGEQDTRQEVRHLKDEK